MTVSNKSRYRKLETIEQKINFFRNLEMNHKADLLLGFNPRYISEILNNISDDEIIEIFEYLDPDEVADLIHSIHSRKKKKILNKLNLDLKKKLDFLLNFSPSSAAGIMSLNYIIIEFGTSQKEIENRIKSHLKNGKKEPTILVINKRGNLIGELRLSVFLIDKNKNIYSKIKSLPTVKYNEDQEEVTHIFKKNKHEKLVVLDEKGYILGVIHARDIVRIIDEENTEDFYKISGLQKEEDIADGALEKVKYRLGWLILNLFTAFIAAFVVSRFEETISKFVLLAAFMPIVAGMGGNAGTQTTAILVRSLALKTIDSSFARKILTSEIFAGFLNGLVIGLIVTLIAMIFNENILFGLVVGVALMCNIILASIFGTIVPLLLKKFGFDPASSSSVFVTTSTDVLGFLIFLSLATVILL